MILIRMTKTDDYSENFHMLAEDWLSKKEGEITSKRIDDRYGVVNKILLKFKADESFWKTRADE